MAIVVHHLDNSRSQRVLWLLEELGLRYEILRYQRDPQTMLAPESLRRVHPLGKSPVLADDDRVLAESGAIVEYLVDRYGNGRLAPARDTAERVRYTYWLHYAEGSAMPPLLLKLVFAKVAGANVPFFVKPITKGIVDSVNRRFIRPQLNLHFDYLEDELAKNPWFVDSGFSAADIQLSFPIEAAAAGGVLGTRRPRLSDWLARIHARSAYRRALERGGPYDYANA